MSRPDQATLLELAKSLMAEQQWVQAAQYFDDYVRAVSDDWKAQFLRALAHANSRIGITSNLSALRAYNEAIALAPVYIDRALVARLVAYRSAIYKRLGRLAEAEADLALAEAMSDDRRVRLNVLYNRACLYALTGRRNDAIATVTKLKGSPLIEAVAVHRNDYFQSVRDEPEFLAAIEGVGEMGADYDDRVAGAMQLAE
jgi:tetratricopeptide (TPR) repeat protein